MVITDHRDLHIFWDCSRRLVCYRGMEVRQVSINAPTNLQESKQLGITRGRLLPQHDCDRSVLFSPSVFSRGPKSIAPHVWGLSTPIHPIPLNHKRCNGVCSPRDRKISHGNASLYSPHGFGTRTFHRPTIILQLDETYHLSAPCRLRRRSKFPVSTHRSAGHNSASGPRSGIINF